MNFSKAVEWLTSGQEIRRSSWNTLFVLTMEKGHGLVAWDDGAIGGAPRLCTPSQDDLLANDWTARKNDTPRVLPPDFPIPHIVPISCDPPVDVKAETVRVDPPGVADVARIYNPPSERGHFNGPIPPPSAFLLKHRQEMGAKISNWFVYHAPTQDQRVSYERIRSAAKNFAILLVEETPPGADQSAAMRLLRECVMTANQSIACEGK